MSESSQITRDDSRAEDFVVRSFCIERLRDESTQETAYRVSLSSETPVKDWPWAPPNILVHEKSAIDMDGVAERGLPLFVNHDARELSSMVGRIVNVRLERKRLIGDLKFSQANPEASMVRAMVDEGTLTDMSIRAEPIKIQRTEGSDGSTESVKWLRWRPIEASIVGFGADRNIGIGRANASSSTTPAQPAATQGVTKVADETAAAGANAENQNQGNGQSVARSGVDSSEALSVAQKKLNEMNAQELEQARIRTIENLARSHNIPDGTRDLWVRQGYNILQVSNDILKILEERGKYDPQPASRLGLTRGETQQFSFLRAIEACAEQDWTKAGFELNCSKTVAQRLGRTVDKKRFYVPFEVMERPVDLTMRQSLGMVTRDLTVATAGAGGFLVATENQGFIEILRNRSVAFRMGARRLSGLVGSVTVPRQSAAATAVWLANEASTITESQQTFVQMALAPKSVGAYTEISRQLLLQSSPGAEGIVTDDLAQQVALAADLAVLEGSGAGGQPTGISNTAGIGSVTGTSLAAAGIIEFQTDVATANVQPMRGGYVSTPAVAGLLMTRPELPTTGTERLWKGNIWNGSLFDFPAMTSNQLTAATMIFGDWQEVVVGEWGVLEVEVNPYANFQAGIIGVRAIYSLDVGVRRPFAFSRATTIT